MVMPLIWALDAQRRRNTSAESETAKVPFDPAQYGVG
jgi:hypothetical protein